MERPDLAVELERLAEEDRAVRDQLAQRGLLGNGYSEEMRKIHRRNGDRLHQILDELGAWPGYESVGPSGSNAAFTIANHDISDPLLMRRCRDAYQEAVVNNDAEPSRLAYLVDRICKYEGSGQWYGTQLGWDDRGEFGPWPPVVEPDLVDHRRRLLGLTALADAIAVAAQGHRMHRTPAEVAKEHREEVAFAIDVGWRLRDQQ